MAVMYHKIFEVDPKFVAGGKYQFEPTGNGEMIIATYKGRKFFVKRDMHLRYPARSDSAAVREQKLSQVRPREKKQEKLRKLMSGLTWDKDFIVVEEMNFGDNDLQFTTVTALVPDVFPKKYNFSGIDLKQFLFMATEMAKRLVVLHERGIIHADLKEDNIIVQKGTYKPYLIDFDTSYPATDIPEWDGVGGTDGYQSPEVLIYGSDEDASPKSTITTAGDIFSLAIVFHRWWTNAFPSVDFEKPWAGAAIYLDKKVFIDKKFGAIIGTNNDVAITSLLYWMLAKDPAKRPTAKEVVAVLSDEMEVPEEYCLESDKDKFDTELWPAHTFVADLYTVATLKKKDVKSFKRINDGSGSEGLKYLVKLKDGKEKALSIDEVIKFGYGKRKNAVTDEPWEDHFIDFESPTIISEKGYAKIERAEMAYKKLYLVTTSGGRSFSKSHEWLLNEGLARPKKATVDADTPWPEDGVEYNTTNMAKMGVKSIRRLELGGRHAYEIIYKDGTKSPPAPSKNLALMGYFKK